MHQSGCGELRSELSLHPLDKQGILLDPLAQKLYRFNSSAVLIWRVLKRTRSLEIAQRRLQQRTGLSAKAAAEYIRVAVAEWHGMGFLRSSQTTPRPASERREVSAGNGAPGTGQSRPRKALRSVTPIRGRVVAYRVLDSVAAIWLPSERIAKLVQGAFPNSALAPSMQSSYLMRLLRENGGFRLVSDGHTISEWVDEREVVPRLKLALTMLALGQCQGLGAVHAAAVRGNGRAILLPGPAGAGKSTLAACLMAQGWEVLADDTTVLTNDGTAVRALPLPLCIKRGAWPSLTSMIPELGQLPVHRRADRQYVRYLVPRTGTPASEPSSSVSQIGAIVFPRYREGAALEALSIGPADALEALLPQFYPLQNRFDSDTVDRLIRLVSGAASIRVTYGRVEDAVDVARTILC